MEERLAAEERTRRELVAAVSHDLRTPVTNLRLLAEAVEDGVIPEQRRREYLSQLGVHVRRLGALIDDLFELSRLEAGDIRWTAERVDVEGLVAEAVEAMRPQADAGAIAVHAELAADVGAAHADPEQLQRVLYNLLQNAVRHTPADGSVVVRAARTPGGVEIEVADTGPGIPPGEREQVFEPFTRGDASRSSDGAGLGLAIARAIVEAHGGRIWLAEAAAGTRVRFSVPAA
jgi:signal transduction histidine kinase